MQFTQEEGNNGVSLDLLMIQKKLYIHYCAQFLLGPDAALKSFELFPAATNEKQLTI